MNGTVPEPHEAQATGSPDSRFWRSPSPDGTFRILSLSGGGYLGLYSAHVLARMEEAAGAPIARHFDLVCGTSVGAITAMALSLEIPATEIEAAIIRDGPSIFQPRSARWGIGLIGSFIRDLWGPRYSDAPLRESFAGLLGAETTLGEARCRLAIPAVNMTTGQIEIFKTPHNKDWSQHAGLRMADIGLAVTAAPTFFPMAALGGSLYTDGALFANAPDLVGLHEAEYYLGLPRERIRMLSIGTTTSNFSVPQRLGRNYGVIRWLRNARLFSTILATQQQLTRAFLTHHLGAAHLRVDSIRAPGHELDLGFDSASEAGTGTIRSLADFAFENAMKHADLPAYLFSGRAAGPQGDGAALARQPGSQHLGNLVQGRDPGIGGTD
jgi:patatin-like phospholipase/acyl hydrolase